MAVFLNHSDFAFLQNPPPPLGALDPIVIGGAIVGLLLLLWAGRWAMQRAKHDGEERPEPLTESGSEPGEAPGNIKDVLARTRNEGFVSKLASLFKEKQIDVDLLDEIEAVLYTSDLGVQTTEKLLDSIRTHLKGKELSDGDALWRHLRKQASDMLRKAHETPRPSAADNKPHVMMMVGVNGTGKTTSIGKIANELHGQGKRVLLGAGDTFRAAAVEQLEVWATRVGVDIWKGDDGADPASVLYDTIEHAKKEGHDVVLADTAGRLHTNTNLVRELEKVHRVMGKALEGAPHEVLLVLDATTGQNAIQQAKMFSEAVPVHGIILTKLDGTAKGGVVIGIADELGLPIRLIGVGERLQDLRPFDPDAFIEGMFGGSSH
jgi:fused signal recognition particle receptor